MADTVDTVARLLASALVAAIGVGLGAVIVASAVATELALPGLALAALGSILAAILLVAGPLLYRSDFTATHSLRVAGWALFGAGLLGLVLALIVVAGTPIPAYAAATLLAIGTLAHVLVGVRDVQRVRATALAGQREQFELLNRVVRHNLSHEAQLLLFAVERLEREDMADEDVAADVENVADELSSMNDLLDRSRALIRGEAGPASTVDLRAILVDLVEEFREVHPDASIELVVPDTCRVRSGEELRRAVRELIENALVHTGRAPTVTVDASNLDEHVLLEVSDDGPGIPEEERAVIEREADVDQLAHNTGLGLWFVRWVVEAYGGGLEFEVDDEGTTVRVVLPAA